MTIAYLRFAMFAAAALGVPAVLMAAPGAGLVKPVHYSFTWNGVFEILSIIQTGIIDHSFSFAE